MKRIVGFLGWLGVVLVVAAVVAAVRACRTCTRGLSALALAGLVVTALYALSQWRDIARSFQGRNVKYGSIAAASVAARPRRSSSASTGSRTGRTSAGTSPPAGSSRCPTRRSRSCASLDQARDDPVVLRRQDRAAVPRSARRVHVPTRSRSRRSTSTPSSRPDRGAEVRHHRGADGHRSSTSGRTERTNRPTKQSSRTR